MTKNTKPYEYLIIDVPDYPKPGIVFKDIMPVISDAKAFHYAVSEMADNYRDSNITKIVGVEARGFLFGSAIAYILGCGFVPARKPGKLPREIISTKYELEYGIDEIQIQADALNDKDKVIIVDDLLATGGTAAAVGKLVRTTGAEIVGYSFFIELDFLEGREKLLKVTPDAEVDVLVHVGR